MILVSVKSASNASADSERIDLKILIYSLFQAKLRGCNYALQLLEDKHFNNPPPKALSIFSNKCFGLFIPSDRSSVVFRASVLCIFNANL